MCASIMYLFYNKFYLYIYKNKFFSADHTISKWLSLPLSRGRKHIKAFYEFKENAFMSLHPLPV